MKYMDGGWPKMWFEWGPTGDSLAFGLQFCWEDSHLRQYRLSLDLGFWYFNMYLRLGDGGEVNDAWREVRQREDTATAPEGR